MHNDEAEVETIQKLIDLQESKVQHDLELMSSLIDTLKVARRQAEGAKPWNGPEWWSDQALDWTRKNQKRLNSRS